MPTKAETGVQAGARRIVVDTNVWISAALSSGGAPSRLISLILTRDLPVFSEATFAELESRLWKPKFDPYLSIEKRRRILHDLDAASLWLEPSAAQTSRTYSRDRDDDKFVHLALAAESPWLISGDGDLLDIEALPKLRILPPAVALKEIYGDEAG